MHGWTLITTFSLLVAGAPSRGVNAERAGKQPAAKTPNPPPGRDMSAYEEGEGGILYGKGWAFLISAPKGWVMDEQATLMGGQANVAFYRRGQSWAKSPAVMYGNVIPKIKGEDDTLEKVVRGDVEQTKERDPKMKAAAGEPLTTVDGRKAVVYTFSGPGTGRSQEQVAYIDTPHFVIMLVLTARSEADYKGALPDFVRLVQSFGFFTGGVQIHQARPHTPDGSKKGN
jgi:hypothetical protein